MAWPAAAIPAPLAGKLVYLQGQVEVRAGDRSAWVAARIRQGERDAAAAPRALGYCTEK